MRNGEPGVKRAIQRHRGLLLALLFGGLSLFLTSCITIHRSPDLLELVAKHSTDGPPLVKAALSGSSLELTMTFTDSYPIAYEKVTAVTVDGVAASSWTPHWFVRIPAGDRIYKVLVPAKPLKKGLHHHWELKGGCSYPDGYSTPSDTWQGDFDYLIKKP